jgi:tetratricopeptide (TPR) repeat protein
MRAHHVEWSARHGDLDAVATLREAGEAAQQRTPESAARWFGAALRLLPSTSSSDDRAELLLAQAGALAAAGRFAESHSALVDTMKILPSDAMVMRARLTARCARLEHLLLRRVEARIRLERALAEVHDRDSPEAVSLMLALAVEGNVYTFTYVDATNVSSPKVPIIVKMVLRIVDKDNIVQEWTSRTDGKLDALVVELHRVK